jgi:hypothetical protein
VLRSLLRLDRPQRERPGWLTALGGRLPLSGRIGANAGSAPSANGRVQPAAPAARREIETTKTT